MTEQGGLMKGRGGWLFWIPAAVLALFFVLGSLYAYIQNMMAFDRALPAAVIAASVAWAAALTLGWLVSFILLALRTGKKTYMAGFLVLAAAALLNFVPTCFGGYYMIYALTNTYHVTVPISKITTAAVAVVCLFQAVAYAVFLFARGGNAVVRVGSAVALLCALAAMVSSLLQLLIPTIAGSAPRLPVILSYFANACNNMGAFALLAAIGGICFGKPGGHKKNTISMYNPATGPAAQG